jgi:hypothetical protein
VRGRRHVPTEVSRRQVEALAGFGLPQDDIARVIAIDPTTLRLRYRAELDAGSAKATARVAENLFRIATGSGREAVTAAIFWLKTRARWSEHAPGPRREEAPGKKALAEAASETAAVGTPWEELLIN